MFYKSHSGIEHTKCFILKYFEPGKGNLKWQKFLQSIVISTWHITWPWKMQDPSFSQIAVNIKILIIYQNVCYNIPCWFMAHICNYDSHNVPKILQICKILQKLRPSLSLGKCCKMNILYIVLYVYRMTEHTKCSMVLHYELDKGTESEKKLFALYCGLSLIRNWPLKCNKQNFRKQ